MGMSIVKTETSYSEMQSSAQWLRFSNETRELSCYWRTQHNTLVIEIKNGVLIKKGYATDTSTKNVLDAVDKYIANFNEKPNFFIDHEYIEDVFLKAY